MAPSDEPALGPERVGEREVARVALDRPLREAHDRTWGNVTASAQRTRTTWRMVGRITHAEPTMMPRPLSGTRRDPPLATGGKRRRASWLGTSRLAVVGQNGSARATVHHCLQVVHAPMMLRAERILARGVEPVHLFLQPHVRLRVSEEAVEHAREGTRGSVRARDNREHTIVVELARRRGRLVWEIFVILSTTVSTREEESAR